MGGYLAALYASLHPEVERLVLLAPAFYFPHRWRTAEWEQTGYLDVYHYAEGRERRISYNLVRDAALYPPEPSFSQPALLFHGTEDDVVPAEYSIDFASRHLNARLRLLPSGHQLTDMVDVIWDDVARFLTGG
jgi:pimeloyl-ACP methyl ester carboxylesterase